MPIDNIHSKQKPAFRSMSCEYKLPNNKEMGLYTWMFRNDMDWMQLAQFEIENFKHKDKVNVIQFASSDGSEGYTKILSLIHTNPKESEKFFPIKAFDINKKIVSINNSGIINLTKRDIQRIKDLQIPINKYFTNISTEPNIDIYPYKVNDELSKRIQFNTGDMFELVSSIKDDSNTIILCRNVLDYYDDEKITSFIKQASNVLKKGSLFITGRLETKESIQDIIKEHNFKQVLKNVYIKI